MSGKGAHPFGSAWALGGTGETPSRAVANLLLPGRVDDWPDEDLVVAYEAGKAALKARITAANVHARAYRTAFRADSGVQAAVADYNAEAADIHQQFTLGQITQGQRETLLVAADATLKAAIAAAAATGSLAALRATYRAARAEARPDARENEAKLARAEMKRRGLPVGP